LYNGQCLSSCPDGTYLVPEQPIKHTKYKQQTDDAVSLSLRSSSINNNTTKTNSTEDFSTLDDLLPTHHQRPRTIPQKYCAACNEACFQCYGPANTDCKSCSPNYSISIISPGVVACIYPSNSSRHHAEHELYDEKTIKFSWKNLTIYEMIVIGIFLTFTFLLLGLAVYFVLKKFSCVCLWLCSHRKNDNVQYQYDRIEMDDKSLNGEESTLKKGFTSKTKMGQLKLLENEDLSSAESTDDLD
jgi:hypothetical protein